MVGKRYSYFVATLQIKAYQKVIEEYSQGNLLDCGAGTVPYYGIYKDLVDGVTCIDWGDSYHKLSHIDKEVNLTGKLPFADGTYDTILLSDVIEHLPNPDNIFSETSRLLKKGGHVLIFVPFMYGVHEAPHDYHRYTEFALNEYARRYKLVPVHLEPYGGGPDVVVDVVNKMLDKTPAIYSVHQLIWKFIRAVGLYQKLKKRYTKQFPLGYTFVAKKS